MGIKALSTNVPNNAMVSFYGIDPKINFLTLPCVNASLFVRILTHQSRRSGSKTQ
ncbi:hypothetical protein HCUR_00780 [Holospora curviuscula]|uniref:Uncharacterized protein n=1 Tax=Holospora curviuscula TaxID=1082868 RepID=A0A2S5R9F7_9PROT|nr:hypothetical protein HCUR_00780 [Holospora curviuscula]